MPPWRTRRELPRPPFTSYAAKFVCGLQATDADVVRGIYATAINIHNPQATIAVPFFKKAVIALPERSSTRGQISPFRTETLKPDEAFEVDCTDIRSLFPGVALPKHIEGFVVMEVPAPANGGQPPLLDVIGKYSVRHTNTTGTDTTISDANGVDVVVYSGKSITQ